MNTITNQIKTYNNPIINFGGVRQNKNISPMKSNLQSDMFVKSNNIKFKGNPKKNEINSDNDITNKMAEMGLAGAPLLLSIAAVVYSAKHKAPQDLLIINDDANVSMADKTISTDNVNIDMKKGIIDIKDSGIHINEDDFDIVNFKKGIFKKFDGSVDIDLSNNKYIDLNNGIIIDPENEISSIITDGEIHNVVLPDFVSSNINFTGASMSGWHTSGSGQRLTRSDYIEQYGVTPEEKLGKVYDGKNKLTSALDRVADPNDNRTMGQKIADYFNPTVHPEYTHMYDKTKEYDVFGREVLTYKDSNGTVSKVALDENLSEVVQKYKLNSDSVGELSGFFEKIKTEQYLLESQRDYSHLLKGHSETFSTFIERLNDNHSDVAEIISHDAINETMGNSSEHGETFLETLKNIFEN